MSNLFQILRVSRLKVSQKVSSLVPLINTSSRNLAHDPVHVGAIHSLLKTKGALQLQLDFDDDESLYMHQLMLSLHKYHQHGLPITHSAQRGWFWDVRPSTDKFQSHNHQARSETMHRFDWHTDCSYEEHPPKYFGLQVVQPDRCAGGTLSILSADQLLGPLSRFARELLSSPIYQINVPPEFIKSAEKKYIVGNLLAITAGPEASCKLRFREDIITPLTADASRALDELKSILYSNEAQKKAIHLTPDTLPRGSIIMIDNHRWLHARDEINDPNRHLRRGGDSFPNSSEGLDVKVRAQEREKYIANLSKENSSWPAGAVNASCPCPLLITERHSVTVRKLAEALDLALQDIIGRWWTDEGASFPQRMPLEPEEEDLLRWINDNQGLCRPYTERKGSWRPDFVIENDETGAENFRICEINARFCWNGYMFIGYGQKGLCTSDAEQRGLINASDPDVIFNGLLSLFDPSFRLHLVKGKERGCDIFMFMEFAKKLGLDLQLINPDDLRIMPDPAGVNGFKLCCLAPNDGISTIFTESGESVEEVRQICLELHQHEFRALESEMQRQISLRCLNDMRTILLVHDKRMLGIIREELGSLKSRGVISVEQADRLDKGIATTILPGSLKLLAFMKDCQGLDTLKDKYLLKPTRGGKGAGILFGDELSNSDWLVLLETMRSAEISTKETSYVVQRKICQPHYDIPLGSDVVPSRCYMVGTFHIVNGIFLGLGIWRCSTRRMCAISTGGATWMVSVMRQQQSSHTAFHFFYQLWSGVIATLNTFSF
ncbi:hypothetical protein N7495_001944 [Penicillium taxi]|uniref:uncharacterized protein n=1 Tax=Penicillium taxi TaxID=168475 RepID=UPI0025454242|nr:uncharacterized protein N7495_001944 [Penicillium taxi]KAJ5909262.1 hypothetical protein N7495_001944 [Penicillium taxi]